MAMTTSSSTSVKPRRLAGEERYDIRGNPY
jgi:hypothetical protein